MKLTEFEKTLEKSIDFNYIDFYWIRDSRKIIIENGDREELNIIQNKIGKEFIIEGEAYILVTEVNGDIIILNIDLELPF